MRILILFISLLASVCASAQVDYFATELKNDGTRIGMVEHLTTPTDPVIIWVHGQDANAVQPISIHDTTRISLVTNKGPLRLVRDGTPLPRYQKPGTTGTANQFGWNIVGAQNRSGLWNLEILEKTFDYVMAHPEKWDTSLVMVVAYSLGGGAMQSNLKSSKIGTRAKYVVIIGPGYNNTPTYPTINAQAINIDVFATIDDELVNESIPDGWVNGVKAASPITIPNYYRFVTVPSTATTNPKHDGIEVFIARDTTTGDTQAMTNGSTWTKTENIYQRGLRFFGPRRKPANFFYWFLFALIPLNPLNPSRENGGV
jgi:hypothetical protein